MALFKKAISMTVNKICQINTINAFKHAGRTALCRTVHSSSSLNKQLQIDNTEDDVRIQPPPTRPMAVMPRGAQDFKYTTRGHVKRREKKLREAQIEFSMEKVEEVLQQMEAEQKIHWDDHRPTDMPNPFAPAQKKCILCKYNVHLDYKNPRLLSQFISPHTGRIIGRQHSGLCIPMQKHVAKLIKRARYMGYLPLLFKKLDYVDDPKVLKKNS